MAQGNMYLAVPKADENNIVPAKLQHYGMIKEPILDEEGEPTGEFNETPPTWKQLGEQQKQKYGVIREHTYNDIEYIILELELSYIKQEVHELVALESAEPNEIANYKMLNNEEVRAWLEGEDIFQNIS